MNTYRVSGLALVPVQVEMEVKAPNQEQAMNMANANFKLSRTCRKNSVLNNSADYDAVHGFQASEAEEVKVAA